jgi:hypothetical protein
MTIIPPTGEPDAGTATAAVTGGDRAAPRVGEPPMAATTVVGAIRASDPEREQVVARLHAAVGEGRLSLDEAEERITAVYAVRYREDLTSVVGDLPADDMATAAGDGPPLWSTLWKGAVWRGLRALHGHPVPRPTPPQSRAAALTMVAAVLLFVAFVLLGAGLVA